MYLRSLYPDVPEPIPSQNFHRMLFHRQDMKEWKDHTLFIDAATGKKRSYREFYERVMDGATALGSPIYDKGLGLNGEDGEIIGILSENSMDYITLLHSLLAITTPFTLLSSFSTPYELAHAIRVSNVTRIFVQSKFLPLVQRVAAAEDVGHFLDNHIYILDGHVKGRRSFDQMIHQVRKEFTSRLAVRPAGNDKLAYLAFSSGTSGLPKAVMISHGNLNFTMMQFVVYGMARAEVAAPPPNTPEAIPVILGFLPLHHSYGLHAFGFQLFFAQMTLVLMPKWNLDIALEIIPKYRVTHLCLIPSLAYQLVHSPKAKKADLSTLQFITCSAAYLPDMLKNELLSMAPANAQVLEGYGLTEITLAATTKPSPGTLGGRVKGVPGSVGILMPGVEARILREDGTEAGLNEPGELWLRSGGVALGYKNNKEASRDTFVGGWLKTGDRFLVDKDGTFFYQDRIKDTLKVSGVQVSPVEIENVLLMHPGRLISDTTVVGVPGGRTTDEKIPRAWVVLSEAGARTGEAGVIKALDAWLKDNLSKYKWLRGGIEVVDEIPKSPTGKVLRRLLLDGYNQRIKNSANSKSKL